MNDIILSVSRLSNVHSLMYIIIVDKTVRIISKLVAFVFGRKYDMLDAQLLSHNCDFELHYVADSDMKFRFFCFMCGK